ncbi:MAG: cold shock domain-containing protein [archaeon]
MAEGRVKFFDEMKGYGFITLVDGRDVFVHITAMMPAKVAPKEGDLTRFELIEGDKGLKAADVQILGASIPEESVDNLFN